MAKTAREEILARISDALDADRQAQRPDSALPLHAMHSEIGPDPHFNGLNGNELHELIMRFKAEVIGVGGHFHRASSVRETSDCVRALAIEQSIKSAVTWNSAKFGGDEVISALLGSGVEVTQDHGESQREEFLNRSIGADFCISGVDYALADTGTLVLFSGEGKARSASLLAPVHVAIVRPGQLLSGLSELFSLIPRDKLSSAVTFITGPSRTADIEMTLVVGVHGPQQLHVILQTD